MRPWIPAFSGMTVERNEPSHRIPFRTGASGGPAIWQRLAGRGSCDHLQGMSRPSPSAAPSPEPESWPAGTVFTIGHSIHPIEEFIALLRQAGIRVLVDVRSVPRSRRNPQFNIETLPGTLAEAGIEHRHLKSLGGLRHRPKGAPPSPNGLWQNEAFRNFADHALTEEFRRGFDELLRLAAGRPTAIMCAEALWWRCHRRIIADHLLVQGLPVAHVMGKGKIEAAKLTPGAVVAGDGQLVYPAGQGDLGL